MSKVHLVRQGFLTKSALPNVSRSFTGANINSQLLLLGSGSNGSTTFTDSSVNNNTVNRFGDAVISTAQFPSGMTSSMLFDGTGDYLSVTNANFAPGSQNFTLEAYIYITTNVTSTRQIVGAWGNVTAETNFSMGVYNSNAPYVELYVAGIYYDFLGPQNSITLNTWHHLAFVRFGNVFTLYLNGISRATRTLTGSVISTAVNNTITVGGVGSAGIQFWNGYISNVRHTVGSARYTANFTPPSLPLENNIPPVTYYSSMLLLGNGTNGSTSIVDSSANNLTMTRVGSPTISTVTAPSGMSSSINFPADTYLTTPWNASLFTFAADLTFECYINYSAHEQYAGIFSACQSGAITGFQVIFFDTSDRIFLEYTGGPALTTTNSLPRNTWVHLAVTRTSGVFRVFINGVQDPTTTTNTNSLASGQTIGVNTERIFGRQITGYISNMRVFNNVSLYNSNFTPPALPLANSFSPNVTTINNNIYGVYKNR